jgi:hypothetical protein
LGSIRVLEGVAVDMSKAVDVKFSNRCIPYPRARQADSIDWDSYLDNMKKMYVDCYQPVRLISKAQEMLGEYDFFFEWAEKPTVKQIEDLLGKIDDALEGKGSYYTITTR